MSIINERIDEVTIKIITARLNGETVDEEQVFAAAGLTARAFWRRALGEQCTPETYANLLSCFLADPTDPGTLGDILPVVPGDGPADYGTMRGFDGDLLWVLRRAFQLPKPFFVETRELGDPAPPI